MPEERPVLRDGVIAGLIGAAVVAVWFLIFDIARGRPLLTPALLGSAVFQGITDPSQVIVSAGPILFYTLLHGVAFIGFGVVAASLILAAEREPALLIAFAILFIGFEAFFIGAVAALGRSMLGVLVWWAILAGNMLASVAMLWYFFARHLRGRAAAAPRARSRDPVHGVRGFLLRGHRDRGEVGAGRAVGLGALPRQHLRGDGDALVLLCPPPGAGDAPHRLLGGRLAGDG